jgi:GNAT superfamily N-acetyltransferase
VNDHNIRDVQLEFPQYRIWWEGTGARPPRYVAQARNLQDRPHTVMTPDLAELRTELARATARDHTGDRQARRQAENAPTLLHWVKEDTPRWDADKQRLFGPRELAATGSQESAPGSPLADEWWQVTNNDGTVVGYGRLDSEWGDAEITFLVDPALRGSGIGAFILDRLEEEAAARGLNYIYNVVPSTHPDPRWITHWLLSHRFVPGPDLRRRVRTVKA